MCFEKNNSNRKKSHFGGFPHKDTAVFFLGGWRKRVTCPHVQLIGSSIPTWQLSQREAPLVGEGVVFERPPPGCSKMIPEIGVRKLFLGACSFIATCFNATANAPFGSSFYIRQTSSAISSEKVRGASARRPRDIAAVVFGAVVFLLEVGRAIVWGALLLLALLAWCCLLLGCLPALRCAALLLGSFLLQRGTPFWFVLVPAGGNCFALGTGGIRWSLLVGGLGPVLSIPKLCFKPFRRLSAVGFVLGWHREPLFNNPAGIVG